MNFAIDIRPLLEKYHSGVQEYIINLLINIFKIDSKNQYLLFSSGKQDKITNQDFVNILKNQKNVRRKHLYISNKLLNRFFQLKIFSLDKFLEEPDVFFLPNIAYFHLKKTPYVITFHDLSFEYFPEFYSLDRKIFHYMTQPNKIAKYAKKIIAVSASTKQDLIDLYNIKPNKIAVIYSGISKQNQNKNTIMTDYNFLPKDFILFLGTIEPRKNIESIIKAFEMLESKNLYLVIVGPRGWKCKKIFELAENSKKKDKIIFLGPIKPQARFILYQKAKVFIWPSFFEGFGFPPLEAINAKVPTIISNNSSLPEAVKNKAILIDAYRPQEIFLALKQILNDKNLDIFLRKKQTFLNHFSWEKTATLTLEILTKAGKKI